MMKMLYRKVLCKWMHSEVRSMQNAKKFTNFASRNLSRYLSYSVHVFIFFIIYFLLKESNSCKSLKCSIYQECEVNRYGIAECKCQTTCAKVFRPVCSTDFETFSSECELKRQACLSHRNITIRYMGVCGKMFNDWLYGLYKWLVFLDPQNFCHQNHGICKYGSICQSLGLTNYTCICTSCSEEYAPVCANDISYSNFCKFRHDICQKKMSNVTVKQGSCGIYFLTSSIIS